MTQNDPITDRLSQASVTREKPRARGISVIVPVKDEQATLARLTNKIFGVTQVYANAVEIIFVDDGSKDHSWSVMCELAQKYPGQVRALKLRRNFGKSIALEVGFNVATGMVLFTMDADL